jgi:hypothetical protein
VDLAPYNPERDVPYFSQQFIQAEPPEVSRTRPRPDRLLSQGALGPRKGLEADAAYTARFHGHCEHGECSCELCRGEECEQGTCIPREQGMMKGWEAEAIDALKSATRRTADAVAAMSTAVARLNSLLG